MMTMKNPPWYAPFVSACTIGILCISLFNIYCRKNNEDSNDDGDDKIDDNDYASITVKSSVGILTHQGHVSEVS